mgnify:CR=1 FL=1
MIEQEKKEKTYNVEDFIGVFDNFIPERECKNLIETFDNHHHLRSFLQYCSRLT